MLSKFQLVTELYNETLETVTDNHREWTGFLRAACYNYKCPFDEQILIYAQKPSATAVLPLNDWNQRFGHWVNRGAKGIALFDDAKGRGRLKYYFDISDTHSGRNARPVPTWEMRPWQAESVIETLEHTFGDFADKSTLEDAICAASHNAVADNIGDYLFDLHNCVDDSLLEELDDLNLSHHYTSALETSIAYMLMTRLGLDADRYFAPEDFHHVYEFNTLPTVNALGIATSDIAEVGLREISRTIIQDQQRTEQMGQEAKAAGVPFSEKPFDPDDGFDPYVYDGTMTPEDFRQAQDDFFANAGKSEYDSPKETPNNERSETHGTELSDAGRGESPQSSDAKSARGTLRQVRTNAEGLPHAEAESSLHQSENHRETDRTSDGGAGTSPADGQSHGEPDGSDRGRDGGTESPESPEVGGADEQSEALSGGSGNGEHHPSLSTPERPYLTDERYVSLILLHDGGRVVTRQDIYQFFKTHSDNQQRSEYLKNAYTPTYCEIVVDGNDKHRIGYKAREDGLMMCEGPYLSRTAESVFSWGCVAEFTADMLDKGTFQINLGHMEPPAMMEQMALFDLGGNAPIYETDDSDPSFFAPRTLPQAVVDQALYTAGNDFNSAYRVAEQYRTLRPEEENIAVLKYEFGKDNGRGIVYEGRKYAVWFTDEGIRFAEGTSVRTGSSKTLVSWEDCSKRIAELYTAGHYLGASEQLTAQKQVYNECANGLIECIRDYTGETVLMPIVNACYRSTYVFPECTNAVLAQMETTEGLSGIIDEYHTFTQAVNENPKLMRLYGYNYHSHRINCVLGGVGLEQRPTTVDDAFQRTCEMFISQDELDQYFLQDRTNERLKLHSFFCHHTSAKERADAIKDGYGEFSGSMHSGYSSTKTKKGLRYQRQYQRKEYGDLNLTFSEIAKTYQRLINEGRYITEKEINTIPDYQRKELAVLIRSGFYSIPDDVPRPYNISADYWDAVKAIAPQLMDRAATENILATIKDYLAGANESDRFYDDAERARDGLTDYLNEDYDLFNGWYPGLTAPVFYDDEELEEDFEDGIDPNFDLDKVVDLVSETRALVEDEEKANLPPVVDKTANVINEVSSDVMIEGCPGTWQVVNFERVDFQAYFLLTQTDYNDVRKYIIADQYGKLILDNVQDGFYDLAKHFESQGVGYTVDIGTPTPDLDIDPTDWPNYHTQNLLPLTKKRAMELFDDGATIYTKHSDGGETIVLSANDVQQHDGYFGITRADWHTQRTKEFRELGIGYTSTPHVSKTRNVGEPRQSTVPLDPKGTNYHINDDGLRLGTPREKFGCNIEAIKTLQTLETEGRTATPNQQEILAQYVGWGGLADAFDGAKWPNEYATLKNLLSDSEYSAARASTLTAFYTPPIVVKSIYQTIENMGFATGNILEPACGTGNFMGLLPQTMADSKLYGVELDSINGRIARHLYPTATVVVQGFEKTSYPDNFFDVAVGNVPFGQFKVPDKKYDKQNFSIHDYFFAKALDQVRPNGVVAFVTSSFTMDKKNPAVRKYIAQRADLLGAIRLPNTTFKGNAGTEVTSDILFLQKRDRIVDIEPDWVHLTTLDNGIPINQYFADHPDMVLGDMVFQSGPYGPESTCQPSPDQSLEDLLANTVQNIRGEITDYTRDMEVEESELVAIPADPTVRNFSYTLVNDKVYYRENSVMTPVEVSKTADSRIRGMIALRDCVRTLIEFQTEDYPDEDIRSQQEKLNTLYDRYTAKYGLINSRGNSLAFEQDSAYFLLCSLELVDEDGKLIRKADLFTKRTIRAHHPAERVDTAAEALALSMGEKARVDLSYMEQLTGKSPDELVSDLRGVVFLDPENEGEYLPADEYLSGNVRQKLAMVKGKSDPTYDIHVQALESVQPVDLTASEISVRLGATWVNPDYIQQFAFELLQTPRYAQMGIKVHYSKITGEWRVEGKSKDGGNVRSYSTYGTKRVNAYEIIEASLNLKDVRVFDYYYDDSGKRTSELNKKETAIAQSKQEVIKEQFGEWIWKDPARREVLCKAYNVLFNSNRPREYDGSHISFGGMNPEIQLRQHQVNAIARVMYGGNTLLAHCVGAGKTFEMIGAAMESKRLGLCQKSLFVVPNHLTEQWATEFLQLYPAANILVATRKDFETKNRKKFCGRISTGDYDAVIIGHSQFEKIPMSVERQEAILQQQIDEIIMGIDEAKRDRAENFTIKQMEKTKKTLEQKLDKLNDQSRKDDIVTFEELGVDRLFVDESHYYKNLFLYTKMRNVGGIAQTEAQKSSDLFMKCRYLDELTGGRGIVFATGTPISNSMVELYTIQRYLQMNNLQEQGLQMFDAWAANYGETVTAIELSPEGTGYRAKTRFAKFYNLPELMSMFKNVADIQTADMLSLPIPEVDSHTIALKPTEHQVELVASLADRAEAVRNRLVESNVDNMLLITNDGRKLALDQRLINPLLPDDVGSKTSKCAENVFEIWERTAPQRSTQMIFCDLSTPKNDGAFNVYQDIKDKLIAMGIPQQEIAYIHDAKTETQKKDLFGKVRTGQIRVLLGSTQRMGAGTNVQQKLVALHHVDCPWRPSDLQQREGRIVRQGNENERVEIFSYVTEQTFDAYLYQLVEGKQKFISQIMTSKSPVRSAEDVDETALSYAEIKALATGNPLIKEKMDLDIEVSKLKLFKANHLSQRYSLEDQIAKKFPGQIADHTAQVAGYAADSVTVTEHTQLGANEFSPMVLGEHTFLEKKPAGEALLQLCKEMITHEATAIGTYRGMRMELSFEAFTQECRLHLVGKLRHQVTLGVDIHGNIQRMDNALEGLAQKGENCAERLVELEKQLEVARQEVTVPFARETELRQKLERLEEVNSLLNMDNREKETPEKSKERNQDHER